MRKHRVLACAAALLACAFAAAGCDSAPETTQEAEPANLEAAAAPVAPAGSTIKGRIRLEGRPAGNPIIRMGADPLCSRLNRGKRLVQGIVLNTADGGLANVFVKLDGSFPESPVPAAPVTIEQRDCIYGPRVVGVHVGQMLAVRNSDALMHNVHGLSTSGNDFNVSQPKAGMVQNFSMTEEETMLRLRCDMHGWMTAYIGVVSHPHFAVSSADGAFDITGVPAGTYTLRTWHEHYGELTHTVSVTTGETTMVDIGYTGDENSSPTGVRDLHVPATTLLAAAR